MENQLPSVGRIVHYVSYGTPKGEFKSECRAAIITACNYENEQYKVDLCVLNPTGFFFNQGVIQDPTQNQGGSWHWPERV